LIVINAHLRMRTWASFDNGDVGEEHE
jgi:hypothetical protein